MILLLSPGDKSSRLFILNMQAFDVFDQYQSNPNVLSDRTSPPAGVLESGLLAYLPLNYMIEECNTGNHKRKQELKPLPLYVVLVTACVINLDRLKKISMHLFLLPNILHRLRSVGSNAHFRALRHDIVLMAPCHFLVHLALFVWDKQCLTDFSRRVPERLLD